MSQRDWVRELNSLTDEEVMSGARSLAEDFETEGETPEEKFQAFMASYAYLPPEELKIMRGIAEQQFGLGQSTEEQG